MGAAGGRPRHAAAGARDGAARGRLCHRARAGRSSSWGRQVTWRARAVLQAAAAGSSVVRLLAPPSDAVEECSAPLEQAAGSGCQGWLRRCQVTRIFFAGKAAARSALGCQPTRTAAAVPCPELPCVPILTAFICFGIKLDIVTGYSTDTVCWVHWITGPSYAGAVRKKGYTVNKEWEKERGGARAARKNAVEADVSFIKCFGISRPTPPKEPLIPYGVTAQA